MYMKLKNSFSKGLDILTVISSMLLSIE